MPSGVVYRARRAVRRGLLIVWILFTVAALAGMYRLWWQRERRLYLGKDIFLQRQAVLNRAGIPSAVLESFSKIDSSWPKKIHYKASGDPNTLSFLTYLLIPRIPSGSSEYGIHAGRDKIVYWGKVDSKRGPPTDDVRPGAKGLILSVLLVSLVALGIQAACHAGGINFPTFFGISCLLLMCFSLVSVWIWENARYGFWIYSGLGVIGGGTFVYHRIRIRLKDTLSSSSRPGRRQVQPLSGFLFALGIFSFMLALLMAVIVGPDDWDAWAIWGAKAKVLALAREPLQSVTYFGHADYPLLWPTIWAFSGWCAGGWEEHWGKGWGPVFMVLTALQIYLLLRRWTGRSERALLGAVLFLSIPLVPMVASWGYAEAPLWLMTTGSFGCMLRWQEKNSPFDLLLSALLATAAAYTKNEGVLFSAVSLLWILSIAPKKWKEAFLFYVLPFVLLYLPWFYWTQVVMGMGSHAVDGIYLNFRSILRAFQRLPEAADLIAGIWLDIRQWNLVLWMIGFGSAYGLLRGNRRERLEILVPATLLAGFLGVILFHYQNLAWQVGTSWNRLTLQCVPLFILVLGRQTGWLVGND